VRKKAYNLISGAQVIHKTQPSSFTDTDLQAHLDKLGKKKIVLAGPSPFSPLTHPLTHALPTY